MAAVTTNVVETPSVWDRVLKWFYIVGYNRAATVLASQGKYKEANQCLKYAAELKS